MRNLGTALAELAAQLTAAGVKTTVDPGAIVIPGAWLTLRHVHDFRLDGSGTARLMLYLVAGDYPTPATLDELGQLLALVADWTTDGMVEAVTLAMPNYSAAGLPALAVPIEVEILDTESETSNGD